MSAQIIDGKRIADDIKREVREKTERLKEERRITPGLAFVLVGDNPGSQVYVSMKGKGWEELGFFSVTERMPENTSEKALLAMIEKFNRDPQVHGILVQLPLPKQISEGK